MRNLIAGVLLLAVTACEATLEPGVPDGAVQLTMEEVPQNVAQYLYSGIPDKRRLYIDNADAWATLWAEVTQPYTPPPPVPTIDFANEAVIVAAMGTRSTGGYAIVIEGVYEADNTLYVEVREISPGSNCATTQALTAPVHAVRAPRRGFTVRFVERKETRMC